MSQQTASSASRAVWPGVAQIRNRNSLQSPAARVLAETELWALRAAKLQLEKLLMEDPGSPINQSTKQPCLCGCGKREEGRGNTHLATVFKHQFQARLHRGRATTVKRYFSYNKK